MSGLTNKTVCTIKLSLELENPICVFGAKITCF